MSNSSRGQRSKSALGVVLRPPGYVGFLASFGTGSFPSIIRGGLEQRRRAGGREVRLSGESGQSGRPCTLELFGFRVDLEPSTRTGHG